MYITVAVGIIQTGVSGVSGSPLSVNVVNLPLSIRSSTKTFDCNNAPRNTISAAVNSVHPDSAPESSIPSSTSLPNKNGGRTISRTPAKRG